MPSHTIRLATDGMFYAEYLPDVDCCEGFIEQYDDNFFVNATDDGIDACLDTCFVPIHYCPFCGAKLVVKK